MCRAKAKIKTIIELCLFILGRKKKQLYTLNIDIYIYIEGNVMLQQKKNDMR